LWEKEERARHHRAFDSKQQHSSKHTPAISPRLAREFCFHFLSSKEGAGNAGRADSARSLACE
jgi:hypothetical protein